MQAESALKQADPEGAVVLYRFAAEKEEQALSALSSDKTRTIGITIVSAASLWYKANEFQHAERVAYTGLANGNLPGFAIEQLQTILQIIWHEQRFRQSSIEFVRGQLAVSLAGGEITTGAAPLKLANRKADEISNFFYRINEDSPQQATGFQKEDSSEPTRSKLRGIAPKEIEMIMGRSFRKQGPPRADITDNFRPWLFQASPGSYRFSIRLQKPITQLSLFPDNFPQIEDVTKKFVQILRVSTQETLEELEEIVDDNEYRTGFLKMVRNLAPTGKIFNTLEIRAIDDPNSFPIVLYPSSRDELNIALRRQRELISTDIREEQLIGTLRAVHLDRDWLEISQNEGIPIRIYHTGDVIDDIVGPMVNQRVTVDVALDANGRYSYRDIQLEE